MVMRCTLELKEIDSHSIHKQMLTVGLVVSGFFSSACYRNHDSQFRVRV